MFYNRLLAIGNGSMATERNFNQTEILEFQGYED